MKKCPFCAEEIQEDAIKCRFCDELLARKRWSSIAFGVFTKLIPQCALLFLSLILTIFFIILVFRLFVRLLGLCFNLPLYLSKDAETILTSFFSFLTSILKTIKDLLLF